MFSKILFIFLLLVPCFNVDNGRLYINSVYAEDINFNTDSNLHIEKLYNYDNVKSDINEILSSKQLKSGKFAVAVYSEKLNKWIYTHNYKELLVPASNTKLVTIFTSYSILPDKKIKTKIITDGEITDGVLNGDLYIIGGGDALLSVSDIETIADGIEHKGIKQIRGNIYADGSFFDNITDRFKYSNDKDEVQPTAPVTALSIEKNEVRVVVTTGSRGKPSVHFKPASSAFTFTNRATILVPSRPAKVKQNRKRRKSASLLIIDEKKFYNEYVAIAGDSKLELAAKKKRRTKSSNPITISSQLLSDGRQNFIINGSLPPNRTYSYRLHIKSPELVVAATLKDRLLSGGIKVDGIAAIKKNGNSYNNKIHTLYTFERDIDTIINICNKNSDNYLAEMLFKINGATANKSSNTAESASLTEIEVLKGCGINTQGFVFNDGSGLSRRNKITAEGLVMLLYKTQQQSFAVNFFNSLSVAGIDGTLYKRMRNSFAQKNLIGKTGTHSNISSLSGRVDTKNGDVLYFAFIYNGGNIGYFKTVENQLGIYLSGL